MKNNYRIILGATSMYADNCYNDTFIGADNPEKFKEYDARLKASYATLPEKPNVLHKGQIR